MDSQPPYMIAEGKNQPHRIELNLRDMSQLFNSMDPSPFNDKDLDHDAEEFIVSWAHEYPPGEPVTLHIHLEQWPTYDPSDVIREAIHNYFSYRAKINRLEFRRLIKQGRTSLLIGSLFLTACLLASKLLLAPMAGPWIVIMQESLTIAGWVAMWRPMQIFLYDWWPVLRQGRIYANLSKTPVKVSHKGK